MPRSPQSSHIFLLSPRSLLHMLLMESCSLFALHWNERVSLFYFLWGTAQMRPLKCIKAQNNSLSLCEGEKCLPTARVLANMSVYLVLLKMEYVYLCLLSKKRIQMCPVKQQNICTLTKAIQFCIHIYKWKWMCIRFIKEVLTRTDANGRPF